MTENLSDSATLLKPRQRSGLATTLMTLEEMLCHIELTISGRCCKGALYEMRDDVPPALKDELLKRITLARERIGVMAKLFDLEKRTKDASRDFLGKLVYGWEILEGTKARNLRGYGPVAEGLSEELDPHIKELIVIVDEMRDLLSGQDK